MNLIVAILVGALVGWLASLIMRTDEQQGAFLNIVIGILGAVFGSFLFGDLLGIGSAKLAGSFSLIGIFWALLGSVVLVAIFKAFRLLR